MNPELSLAQFELVPQHLPHLPARVRNSLLALLIRWDAYAEALDCLAYLDVERFVSFQDQKAQALLGLGRADEAVAVMEARLAQRPSTTASLLAARCYLSAGRFEDAGAVLQPVMQTGNGPAWSQFGRLCLDMGRPDDAERAFLHHRQLAPGSRAPLFGLARLAYARGDGVTAAAYSVQAFAIQEDERPLTVNELREAVALFGLLGDANRQDEAAAALQQRFEQECETLRAELAVDGSANQPAPSVNEGRPLASPPLSDLAQITVAGDVVAELEKAASLYFGFAGLRTGQAEVMASTRRGEDVLAILPTGAGKSLCYQLPALLDGGLTLVISPLIALMKDQVDNLPPALRTRAIAINSSMDGETLDEAVADVAAGRYQLIYAAPERLRQRPFLHALRSAGLTRLVIDEAHCVSAWGHDFRPDYLQIADAHRQLGAPPILALTATAPTLVREDIERRLFGDAAAGTRRLQVVALDSFRPNLRLATFKVADKDGKYEQLLDLCTMLAGSGIVYARTRNDCEELAALLVSRGVDAVHYHAGIADRAGVQDRFMRGDVRVIVATIAFGMGIDKPDIRFIIHFGLPDSLEAYYQEAGRAGRDGQPASCVLLYSSSDKSRLTRNANRDALTIEFLRELYGVVRRGRHVGSSVLVPLDDVARVLGGDDTRVRVGLSMLEQVGLLRRHPDAPRSVELRMLAQAGEPCRQFAAAAHLRTHQAVVRSYADLCLSTESDPVALEPLLLSWRDAQWLEVRTAGRDLLLELLPPPADGTARITALLDRYAAIQAQRIEEIAAYARSRRCLHGHIAGYLGGIQRTRCTVCNRCVGDELLPTVQSDLPGEREQLHMILSVLSTQSWGRRTLIYLLRGEGRAGERAQQAKAYGCINFRSASALDRLIEVLIQGGFVEEVVLSHGGVALAISAMGREALNDPALLAPLVDRPGPSSPAAISPSTSLSETPADGEAQARYERLAAWRHGQAQTLGVPAFMVAGNEVLRQIALAAPQSLAALAKVKGIGPAKLEQFGEAILAAVAETE